MKNYYLRRGLAFLIDLLIVGLIGVILGFIPIPSNMEHIMFYFIVILWLLKDVVYKDGSVGKRIMQLKLYFNNPNLNFRIISRVLRNITLIIWPIEAILVIIFKKRLGDYIFGTLVHEK